jgi:hypothetical protein
MESSQDWTILERLLEKLPPYAREFSPMSQSRFLYGFL